MSAAADVSVETEDVGEADLASAAEAEVAIARFEAMSREEVADELRRNGIDAAATVRAVRALIQQKLAETRPAAASRSAARRAVTARA